MSFTRNLKEPETWNSCSTGNCRNAASSFTIDIAKSGTRREDLLLTPDEQEAVYNMRKALNGMKSEEAVEQILNMFARTRNNGELIQILKKQK